MNDLTGLRDLFEQFLRIESKEARRRFAFANPPLLHRRKLEWLLESAGDDGDRAANIDALGQLLSRLAWHSDEWELGHGSIEKILVRQGRRPKATRDDPRVSPAVRPR